MDMLLAIYRNNKDCNARLFLKISVSSRLSMVSECRKSDGQRTGEGLDFGYRTEKRLKFYGTAQQNVSILSTELKFPFI